MTQADVLAQLQQLQTMQGIEKLLHIVARLRHPTEGCPWDLKQTHQSLKPYMLEEAYEAVEAIDEAAASADFDCLKEELGDVLLQVVLHSQVAQDAGTFNFEEVCDAISEKLVRRHPHVFGTVDVADADAVVANWEAIKQAEKAKKALETPSAAERSLQADSVLKEVAKSQPALSRALDTSKRAVKVGFEWPNLDSLWDCVMSEYDEFQAEIRQLPLDAPVPPALFDRLESEMGDILFANVNLARHFKIDPEIALTKATAKFTRRFQAMERLLLAEAATFDPVQSELTSERASSDPGPLDLGTSTTASMPSPSLAERMSTLSFEEWDVLWLRAKAICEAVDSTSA